MADSFYQKVFQGSLSDSNNEVVVRLPAYDDRAWNQPALGTVFSTEFRTLEPLSATTKFRISLREADTGTILETVSTADISNFLMTGALDFKTTIKDEIQYELVIAALDEQSFSPALFEVLVDAVPQFGGIGNTFGDNEGHEIAYFEATNLGNFASLEAYSYYLALTSGTNSETLNIVYAGPDAKLTITGLKTNRTNEYDIKSGEPLPYVVTSSEEVLKFEFKTLDEFDSFSFELESDTLGARVQSSPLVYVGDDYASSDYKNLTVISGSEPAYEVPHLNLTVGNSVALSSLFDFSDDVTHVYLNGVIQGTDTSPELEIVLDTSEKAKLSSSAPLVLTLEEFRAASVTYTSVDDERITLIAAGRRIDDALTTQSIFTNFNQFDTSGYAQIDISPTTTDIDFSLDKTSLAEGETGTLTLQINGFDFNSTDTDNLPEIRLISYSQDVAFSDPSTIISSTSSASTAITLPIKNASTEIILTARQDADLIALEDVEIFAEIISTDPSTAVLSTIPLAPIKLTVTDLVPEVTVQYDQATILNEGANGDAFQYTVTVENWDQVSSKYSEGNPGLFVKPELDAAFDIATIGGTTNANGLYQITTGSISFKVTPVVDLSASEKTPANLINKFFVNGKEIDLGTKYLDVKWVPSDFSDAISQSGTEQNDSFQANTIATNFNGSNGNDKLTISDANAMVGSHFDGGNGNDTIIFDLTIDNFTFGFSPTGAPQIMMANDASQSVSITSVEQAEFGGVSYTVSSAQTGSNTGTDGPNLFFVKASKTLINDEALGDDDIVVSQLSASTQDFVGIEQFVLAGNQDAILDASTAEFGVDLTGNDANNTITGSQYDDTIHASRGIDQIDGGDGTNDIVSFSLNRDSYNIYEFGSYFYVINSSQPALQISKVTNVENFKFSDVELEVSSLAPFFKTPTALTIDEDSVSIVSLISSDVDNDTLEYTFSEPSNGSVVNNGDGTYTYTPDANYNGSDSFTITVSDGTVDVSETVNVTVNPVNDAPVGVSDTVFTIEDSELTYGPAVFLDNDTDVEEEPLTIASVTPGTGGTAVLNDNGSVTFTPTADFYGTAHFTYIATDGVADSAPIAVNVNVTNINDAPVISRQITSDLLNELMVLTAPQVTDADGLPNAVSFSYQWALDGSPIDSANDATYTLTDIDYGKDITVSVSYTDLAGMDETITSSVFVAEQLAAGVTQTTTTSEENGISQENKVLRNTAQTSTTVNVLQNSGSSSQAVSAVLPAAVSLSVERPTTTLARDVAVDSLLNSIAQRKSTSSQTNSEEETQSLTDWSSRLANLGSSTTLDIATFTPVAPTTAPLSSPIVISGGASGAGLNTQRAFVIDTQSLPTGSTIQLDHIEFASIFGNATITGGSGANDVIADSGEQYIVLGEDDDRLEAGGGDDIVGSQGGNDTVFGGAGNDVTFGGTGNDSVNGGTGNDKVTDSWGADELNGDDGNDVIRSFEGGDIINGGAGADTIYGSRGDDVISGGDDNDVIYGDTFVFASRGEDELSGGNGDDVLQGGFGADTFIFNSGETGDNRIERIATQTADFEVGIDTIKLLGFDGDLTADNILSQWDNTTEGAKLTAGDMSILLTGISTDDLLVTDFVFV